MKKGISRKQQISLELVGLWLELCGYIRRKEYKTALVMLKHGKEGLKRKREAARLN
ncbi:hypothetical protein ACSLOU_00600 [Enterobacter cloacae]|uniref:hypothetical protein n=1 Tax=Enterobacter cloacae TaxID=550 RepID=UPI003EDF7942